MNLSLIDAEYGTLVGQRINIRVPDRGIGYPSDSKLDKKF